MRNKVILQEAQTVTYSEFSKLNPGQILEIPTIEGVPRYALRTERFLGDDNYGYYLDNGGIVSGTINGRLVREAETIIVTVQDIYRGM